MSVVYFPPYDPNAPAWTCKDAWLAYRKAISLRVCVDCNGCDACEKPLPVPRFGGSSIGAILNISPYETVYQKFRRDTGIEDPPPPNKFMRDGNKYEDVAHVIWQAKHPQTVLLRGITFPYKERYNVSPDGVVAYNGVDFRVFEIKTLSGLNWDQVNSWSQYPYGIHPKYYPQLELYCRAHNVERAVLFMTLRNHSAASLDFFEMDPGQQRIYLQDHPGLIELMSVELHYKRSDSLWSYIEDRVAWYTALLSQSDPIQPKRNADGVLTRNVAILHVAQLVGQDQ